MNILPEKDIAEIETEEGKKTSPHRARLMLLAKLALTGGMLALVFARIDFAEMASRLRNLPPVNVLFAFVLLNVAQCLSALRMRYYFSVAGWRFAWRFTVAIYYVGALFNLVLPGGISGDGYKAWFLKRNLGVPLGLAVRRMLSERANGLFFLLLYALILLLLSPLSDNLPGGKTLLALGIPGLVACYLVSIRLVMKELPRTALGASRFSAASQLLIALSALPVFLGMGADTGQISDYVALFLISSVITILPISVGGAGVREMTFLYGGSLLHLDVELGIAASLAFFAMQAATSLVGFVFLKRLNALAAEQRTLLEKTP